MPHNQEKNQTIGTGSEMNKMMELADKDVKTDTINTLICLKM